uniref:Uncharacterized protein n=1 Tax=Arundo donax TaxID=35708 RepID=A0A0A9GTJ1_ARUDO
MHLSALRIKYHLTGFNLNSCSADLLLQNILFHIGSS